MTPLFSNAVFAALHDRMKMLRHALGNFQAPPGVSRDAWLDRLCQCLLGHIQGNFAVSAASAGVLPDTPELTLRGNDVAVEWPTGRVRVGQFAAARAWGAGLFHWVAVGLAIALPALREEVGPFSLLLDLGKGELPVTGDDAPFVEFCRRGPVLPLQSSVILVGTTRAEQSTDKTIHYSRQPVLAAIRLARLGALSRARLLWSHLIAFGRWVMFAATHPCAELVWGEAAYVPAIQAMEMRGRLVAVVWTCSSYKLQPLWARGLRVATTHMIYYSQNWMPPTEHTEIEADYPFVPWIRVDTHWVWTRAFAKFIESRCGGHACVVGPLLFRLLPDRRSMASSLVSIFDVPAVPDSIMLHLNGEVRNPYRSEILKAFVRESIVAIDLAATRLGRPLTAQLKPKRGMSPHYDREYFDWLDKLTQSGELVKADPRHTLGDHVAASAFVIAFPFTSPAYIAEILDVPAAFFDVTGRLRNCSFADGDRVVVAASTRELSDAIVRALSAGSERA